MEPTLSPYLTFNGNAAEAMKFYQTVLGGELKLQTFGEAKMAETPDQEKLIIHADLKGGGLSFMASDAMPGKGAKVGDSVHMSVVGSDSDRLTKIFNGLAVGGTVDLPLAKQFWGDVYGQLTDKFGVHWMIDITANQNPQ